MSDRGIPPGMEELRQLLDEDVCAPDISTLDPAAFESMLAGAQQVVQVEPGPLQKPVFLRKLDRLKPKGKTPLSAAVRQEEALRRQGRRRRSQMSHEEKSRPEQRKSEQQRGRRVR